MRYSSLVIALLLGGSLVHQVVAADWAQWRGPYQTGHVLKGSSGLKELSPSPKTIWRIKIGEGFGSPVVAGGKVFYLDHQSGREVVHALGADDGKEVWQADLDKGFRDGISSSGARGTPMYHEGLVYAQSCMGQFKCLNASDGKLVWEINFKKDFQAPFIGERGKAQGASRHGNTASPVVVGEDIFVAVGGTNGASMVCFNRKTGKERWRSQSDRAAHAPIVYGKLSGKNQLVYFTVDGVIGLDSADGALLWRVPAETSYGRHVIAPIIHDDMVVYSSHEIGLIGLKIKASSDGFKAETAWVNKKSAINFACPVGVGDYLYGVGPNKDFICVKMSTGKEQWSQRGLLQGDAKRAYAGFLVLGDNILTLTDGGTAALFAADPTQYRELGRSQVCGFNWCNPAFADGQLYLRDKRNLYRLEL